MAGFAALIGGLGAGAQRYGEQQRQLQMQQWGQIQNHLADMIAQARQSATTPERQVALDQLRSKVLTLKPGQDPSKLMQDVQDHLTLHPVAAAAMSGPQQQAPPPGPTPVGQAAGTGGNALANMIGTSGDSSQGVPPAAQPATSPVSPAAQGSPAPQQQPTVPQAAPQQIPPVNLSDQVRNSYGSALASGTMPQALQTAAQPFLTNTAELDRAKMMDQYLLQELGPQRLAAIKQNTPNWNQMSPYVQAQIAGSAMGIQMPQMGGMLSSMMSPIHLTGQTADSVIQRWPEFAKAAGIQPGGQPVDVLLDKMSEQPVSIGGHAFRNQTMQGQTVDGTPVMMQESPYQTPGVLGPVGDATPTPPSTLSAGNRQISGIGDSGQFNINTQRRVMQGLPSFPTDVLPPAVLPHTTTGTRSVTTTGPDGQAQTEFAPVSTTRSIQGVGAPSGKQAAPSGAGQTFNKPFTPAQSLSNEQQLETVSRAQSVMQRLRANSHLMDSMIESGKLKIETGEGGLLRAVIAKNLPLTPAEAQFAGDFDTMAEDINLLRKPLGGAGFRGEEAWTALQGLKGSLLKNPDVSRRVMDNTLAAFEAIRAPLDKAVHGKGAGVPPVSGSNNDPLGIRKK